MSATPAGTSRRDNVDGRCPGVRGYRCARHRHGRVDGLAVPTDAVSLVVEFAPGSAGRHARGGARGGSVTLHGLRTRPRYRLDGDGPCALEVALEPWAAFGLFGVPMHAVMDGAADLRDVPGVAAGDLVGAVEGCWNQRVRAFDRALALLWARGRRCSPYVLRAWELLTSSGGSVPVSGLAAASNCSQRSLERGFREQIGPPPKLAGRVVRFQRALGLLVAGHRTAGVAAVCGYYDQAHLMRDFSAMTGRSISRYLLERTAHPGPGGATAGGWVCPRSSSATG